MNGARGQLSTVPPPPSKALLPPTRRLCRQHQLHPAYCDVIGSVTTTNPGPNQVRFELGLPTAWNGLFAFIGDGGFSGNPLDSSTIFLGVSLGFCDRGPQQTGHEDLNPWNASWALNNQAKQDDFLFRSVHVSTVASKAITQAFYDQPVGSAFFIGSSTGGREGFCWKRNNTRPTSMALWPGRPRSAIGSPGFNWNVKHLTASPESYLPPDKIALLDAAVLENCDGRDGVLDGLIQDPRKCTFRYPSHLRCKQGNDSNCLTAEQVKTLKAIYAGRVD